VEAWSHLGEVLEKDGLLSSELKEQVRRTLAQSNGCEYCKAKGKPEPHTFNEKISVAVGFAEVFLKQKRDISDSAFEILREYFSEGEISELCAFITFTTAQQYFGAIMKLEASETGY
jgi:alkylhydroperoxidase family enzyme